MFRFSYNTTIVHITNHYYLGFIPLKLLKNTHISTLIFVKPKPFGLTEYSQKHKNHSISASTHPYILPVSSVQVLSYSSLIMKSRSTIPFGKLMYTFVFNFPSRRAASASNNSHNQLRRRHQAPEYTKKRRVNRGDKSYAQGTGGK